MLNNLLNVNLYDVLFFGIPAVIVVVFLLSLGLYLSAKRKRKADPRAVSENTLRARKAFLILMWFPMAGVLVIVGGYIILVAGVIAFM